MIYAKDRNWMMRVGGDDRTDFAVAGMAAGLVSGTVMILAMMVYTAAIGEGFLFPLQQIAATFMGVEALIGGAGTVVLGALIHFLVAAVLGAGFGLLLPPGSTKQNAVGWGIAYAVGVWLVMTFAVLPIIDPVMSDRVAMYSGWWFTFHLAYGAVLGLTPQIASELAAREVHTETEVYQRVA